MRGALFALVLAVPLLAGCAQQGGVHVDGGCIETAAADTTPGAFQYGGVACSKSDTETFEWENVAPIAEVQWGGTVGDGSFAISIQDAAGRDVYSASVDAAGSEAAQGPTDPGMPSVPGFAPWTIEIAFTEFTGTMALQVRSG